MDCSPGTIAAVYCVFGFAPSFPRTVGGQPAILVRLHTPAAWISRSTLISNTCWNQATDALFFLFAGAFFILDDPIFSGLAVSLIFGILVSTLLTLVAIPVVYYAYEYRRHEDATEPS